MASGETTRRKLKYPKTGDSYKITKDIQELAEQLDSGGPLLYKAREASFNAEAGELAEVKTSTLTATLPEPKVNTWICFFTAAGVTKLTIKQHSTDKIYGLGLEAANSFELAKELQSVTMTADGTNWLLTAGNPTIPWRVVGEAGQPAFEHAWVNYEGGYHKAEFRKDAAGYVSLRGLVKAGTVGEGNQIFTLPTGYRPGQRELFPTISNGAIGRLDVTTGGLVYPVQGSAEWFTLDPAFFYAEF